MPAQHEDRQIPVPIFRMLGSDPIRQYDHGLGSGRQGVITLEPVYKFGGGDSAWVNWFFNTLVDDPSLGFNYTQAGQENSFTWDAMSKGFEIQMPLIARLRDENKIRVETLETSGKWFRQQFKVTPTTSFSVSKDIGDSDLKTLWFNSRFYRANLLWEKGTLRIRDIHLFNENFPSVYEQQPVTENECKFFTLPLVDGYIWSKSSQLAGLRLKAIIEGEEVLLEGGNPKFTKSGAASMHVSWPLSKLHGSVEIELSEKKMTIQMKTASPVHWFFDLTIAEGVQHPFKSIGINQIDCSFEGMPYSIRIKKGSFSKPSNGAVLRMNPQKNIIQINL